MNDYKTILVSREEFRMTVWLNRPEVHNAMNELMIQELTHFFSYPDKLESSRVIILRGKGKSFCSGADLNYMKGIAGFGFEENMKDGRKLADLFASIYHFPIPTIALVHGSAFGGANGLLAACDIVIAENNTTFAFSEVKLGIAPATISPFVIRRIGEFAAKELMMTGRRFKGPEAEKIHLVNHCQDEQHIEEYLKKTTDEFITSAPEAVRQTKSLIKHVFGKNPDEALDYTSKKIAALRASEEGQEGMVAFLEKRRPKWTQK
jgi:methylglutaconyl-CoA hydratase